MGHVPCLAEIIIMFLDDPLPFMASGVAFLS